MRRAIRSMLLCAVLAAPGAAWAQGSNPAPQPAAPAASSAGGPAAQRAARVKQICQDNYAHAVAQLAFLQARLNLTRPQQPVFAHWQDVKLAIAQHDETDCLTRQIAPRAGQPGPAELLARQARNLKRRIADLEAEGPALNALYAALGDDQKAQLRRSGVMGNGPGNNPGRNRTFGDTAPPPPSPMPGGAPSPAPSPGVSLR
jgi:hypothetical protein